MPVKAQRINARTRDELQRFIAAAGAEEVFQKGDSMTKAQMEAYVHKRVVGDPNDGRQCHWLSFCTSYKHPLT